MASKSRSTTLATAIRATGLVSPSTLDQVTLEVHKIDVTRLRDDKSPIVTGEEIMFVATARFQFIEALAGKSNPWPDSVQVGDDILAIVSDAGITSPLEVDPSHEADIAGWIADHFDFTFTVNHATRVQSVAPDPPWILKLDTSLYANLEYLEVEVDISHKPPAAPPPPAPRKARFTNTLLSTDKIATLTFQIDASKLALGAGPKTFLVKTDSDDEEGEAGPPIQLTIQLNDQTAERRSDVKLNK